MGAQRRVRGRERAKRQRQVRRDRAEREDGLGNPNRAIAASFYWMACCDRYIELCKHTQSNHRCEGFLNIAGVLRGRIGGSGLRSGSGRGSGSGSGSGLGGSRDSFNRRFFSSRSCLDRNISGVRMISRAFSDEWRFVKNVILSFPLSLQFSKFSPFV